MSSVITSKISSIFTWHHGGHIGFPKQWNGGHVGVMKHSCGSWVNTYFWLMATRVKTLYHHKFVLSDSFGQISTHKPSRGKNACHVMFSFYFTRMQIVSKITGAQSVFTTLLKEFCINLFATNLNQKLSISILNCLVYGSSTRITLISTLLCRKVSLICAFQKRRKAVLSKLSKQDDAECHTEF